MLMGAHRTVTAGMTTLAFDTLKAVKALRAAGFGDSQAEAVTEQINVAVGENLATKDDVRTLRTDIENVLEKLELRVTIKLYGAVAGGAGLIKMLDFLIG